MAQRKSFIRVRQSAMNLLQKNPTRTHSHPNTVVPRYSCLSNKAQGLIGNDKRENYDSSPEVTVV